MSGGLPTKNSEKKDLSGLPLVSIVTVVLNGAKHIEQTIQSVSTQTYPNIEYIIIDGGSTDGTLNILKQYTDQIDHWQSEADGGIYFAMNKGIALAKGQIIGILNADDFYLPGAVHNIVQAHLQNNADIYYGDMLVMPEGSSKEAAQRLKPDISVMREKPGIFHPACFVKRSVYEQVGDFDTRFKISSDYEFLLRCLEQKCTFSYVPEPITCFRPGGMSASCYSNVEGYRILKMYRTGHHHKIIYRGLRCYVKSFLKKILHLKK